MDYYVKLVQKQIDKKDKLYLKLNLNKFKNGKLIILYLTKTQINYLRNKPREKYFKKDNNNLFNEISFSKTQICKTFSKVMEINANLTKDKILKLKKSDLLRRAYKIDRDLITFDDDLITFDDDQEPIHGDLIDFETEIPNPKVIPSYGRNILRSLLVSDKVTKTLVIF